MYFYFEFLLLFRQELIILFLFAREFNRGPHVFTGFPLLVGIVAGALPARGADFGF